MGFGLLMAEAFACSDNGGAGAPMIRVAEGGAVSGCGWFWFGFHDWESVSGLFSVTRGPWVRLARVKWLWSRSFRRLRIRFKRSSSEALHVDRSSSRW